MDKKNEPFLTSATKEAKASATSEASEEFTISQKDQISLDFEVQCKLEESNIDIYSLISLIARGAKLGFRYAFNNTALHKAIDSGNLECVKLILNNAPLLVNVVNDEGFSSLHCAIQMGRSDLAIILVEHGANVEITDGLRNTILHMAVNYGNSELIKYVLKIAPKLINESNNRKLSPLHCAIQMGRSDLAIILVEYGANVKNIDPEQYSEALRFAIDKRNTIGNKTKPVNARLNFKETDYEDDEEKSQESNEELSKIEEVATLIAQTAEAAEVAEAAEAAVEINSQATTPVTPTTPVTTTASPTATESPSLQIKIDSARKLEQDNLAEIDR